MKPFSDLNPLAKNISIIHWNRVSDSASFGSIAAACQKGKLMSIYSLGIKTFDEVTFDSVSEKLSRFYDAIPAARGSAIGMEFFANQAVLAVPDDATANSWRDIQAQMYVYLPRCQLSCASIPLAYSC